MWLVVDFWLIYINDLINENDSAVIQLHDIRHNMTCIICLQGDCLRGPFADGGKAFLPGGNIFLGNLVVESDGFLFFSKSSEA